MPRDRRRSGTGITRRSALTAVGAGVVGAATLSTIDPDPQDERRRFNVGYRSREGRTTAVELAGRVLRRFPFASMTVELSERVARRLARTDGIRYVETDPTVHALGPGGCGGGLGGSDHGPRSDPGDTGPGASQRVPWGIDRVGAREAHEAGHTGEGADVAIVDTGIDASHPDLEPNLGDGEAVVECSDGCEAPWDDDGGHGTHCAGTAAAVDGDEGVVGVAPEATLHAVKVLSGSGRGSASDVAEGVERVADNGWDVASLSLGSSRPSKVIRDACRYARSEGVLVVAAAGNAGPCEDCVGYPAAYESAVAVSATEEGDDLAEFSSTGPEVNVAAPGKAIESTFPGGDYREASGTSMACPHVSGAAGLLMAEGVDDEAAAETIAGTAEDIGLDDTEQGDGLLSVADATDAVLTAFHEGAGAH